MPTKRLKSHWRNVPNNYPSAHTTLPPNLTADQIITSYPNHLDDRDVVLYIVDTYSMDCGAIYNAMPTPFKTLGFSKKQDVNMLGSKVYNARGKRSTEALKGARVIYKTQVEGGGQRLRQDETLRRAHPTWVQVGETCAHPALSVAAMWRGGLAGLGAWRVKHYKTLPEEIVSRVAEGARLGGSIEHFIAMAKVARREERKAKEERNGRWEDEDEDEDEGEGEGECEQKTADLRALVFELTLPEK